VTTAYRDERTDVSVRVVLDDKPSRRLQATHHVRESADRVEWLIHSTGIDPGSLREEVEEAADGLCAELTVARSSGTVIEMVHWRRRFVNSDGLRSDRSTTWFGVHGRRGSRWTTTPADAVAALETGATEQVTGPLAGAPANTPVLLRRPVAGILVHELIGHAVEETDLAPGSAVLPAGVSVVRPGRTGEYDDEGAEVGGDLLIVEDGRVAARRPAGDAWCGPHSPRPRPRMLDLHVRASPRTFALPDLYLVVNRLRGGRYFRGQAVLDVAEASLIRDGETWPVAPFRLVISHADLRWRVMPMVSPSDGDPLTGPCIKDGDLMMSTTSAPALLVTEPRTAWHR
jgi:hypothetical protein